LIAAVDRISRMDIYKTTFHINGMDCASEVEMVRMKLGDDPAVYKLLCYLSTREVVVFHNNPADVLLRKI